MQRHAMREPAMAAEDVLRVMARRELTDRSVVCLTVNAGEP